MSCVAEGMYVSTPLPVMDTSELEDVQNHRDHREVAIEQVGVSDLKYPIAALDQV